MRYKVFILLGLILLIAYNKKEDVKKLIVCGDNKIVIINTDDKLHKLPNPYKIPDINFYKSR